MCSCASTHLCEGEVYMFAEARGWTWVWFSWDFLGSLAIELEKSYFHLFITATLSLCHHVWLLLIQGAGDLMLISAFAMKYFTDWDFFSFFPAWVLNKTIKWAKGMFLWCLIPPSTEDSNFLSWQCLGRGKELSAFAATAGNWIQVLCQGTKTNASVVPRTYLSPLHRDSKDDWLDLQLFCQSQSSFHCRDYSNMLRDGTGFPLYSI